MLTFILEKIISGLLTLFGVATVVFFLFNVLPGDPAQMVLDQNATEVQLLKVKKKYGFDMPIGKQYLIYLNDLAPLSFHSKNPDRLYVLYPIEIRWYFTFIIFKN